MQELGYSHVSIGDIMRAEIKSGTDDGKAIEAIVQSGNLVPKELTITLLMKTLSRMDANIVLIDGFPRSTD